MRLKRSEDLVEGDVLALPMRKTATLSEVKVGRRFVSIRSEHGKSRIEVGQEVMLEDLAD